MAFLASWGAAADNAMVANTQPAGEEMFNKTIEEIVEALYSLSRQKIGALIILERKTKIGDIINAVNEAGGENFEE